jgi:hypothetical protein
MRASEPQVRAETPALAVGFISLTAWKGEGTDYRVLAEGGWASQARARLETFAKPAPGCAECFRFTGEGGQARPLESLLQDAPNAGRR